MKKNFLLFLLTILLFACEKKSQSDNINDFQSFNKEFLNPSRGFGTAPLYVWNTTITTGLIDSTMRDLKDKGFGGVFVHPRPGLITEYISEEWYKLFRYTLDKGKELDMNVWIYDENSYPSGFAGGHVPAEMPESYNQGNALLMDRATVLPENVADYYICLEMQDGKYMDITNKIEEKRGKNGDYYLFKKTYPAVSPWYGGFSYVDILYQGVTEKFIDITMNGYKEVVGDEFGAFMPGWFTDEPNIHSNGTRWTPDLFSVFEERWGYDLKENLPLLFEETGNWKQVRHNYIQTLLQMFIDRFAKPCFEYCEENNLLFTGHYWEHGWPDVGHGGDNMAMYAWHQMPAIDMLFNRFDEKSPQAQFGNVRAVKELSSVANQMGYKRTLSETYGAGGWEETFRDFKRLGDWEYALGVNFMNQHLTDLSIIGARKNDHPPTFSEHAPWWDYYKPLNMHYARLSMALSAGEQKNDILILEPTTSVWMYYAYTNIHPKVWEIGNAFQSFVTTLEKAQVEYDLGSENIIKDQGKITGDKFTINKRSYSKVVIPPLMENLDSSTFELLKAFNLNGGVILAFGEPTCLDGVANDEVRSFFAGENVVHLGELTPSMYQKELASTISFEQKAGGNLFHHRRTMQDGQVLFLSNASLTESATGSILLNGKDAIELNTITGEMYDYPETSQDKQIKIDYDLPPTGSLLLYIFNNKQNGFQKAKEKQNYLIVASNSEMCIEPDGENVLTIDYCDLQLGKENFKDLYIFNAADKAFKTHGFELGNPWNTSVQYKDNIVNRDTFTTGGFTVSYKFSIMEDFDMSTMKAIVERSQLYEVSINGEKIEAEPGQWWVDREMNVLDISKHVRKGENILSLNLSPMKIHAEIQPIYILGDFSLLPIAKGFSIKAPNKKFTIGSWKQQGWPFYARGFDYKKTFLIDDIEKSYQVRLNDWYGSVADVIVNGESAGIIGFEPFSIDVTPFIQKGENEVVVKVVGTNKNLMGPFHFNHPLGIAGPGHFLGPETPPSGDQYNQLDYGLMDEFVLEVTQ